MQTPASDHERLVVEKFALAFFDLIESRCASSISWLARALCAAKNFFKNSGL